MNVKPDQAGGPADQVVLIVERAPKVDPHDRPSLIDPDLDPLPRPLSLVREEVRLYQRVVVNPGLAILAWVFLLALSSEPLERFRVFPLLVGLAWVISPLLLHFLLQFHCLDCGAIGWMRRLPEHVCEAVAERKRSRRLRTGGLGADFQVRLWFGLAYLGAACYLILRQRSG